MGTYGSIQDRVQGRVIDLPTFVNSEVPTLVNSAIKILQDQHNFKVMETLMSAQQTTVSTRVLTTLPSAFKEFNGDPYYITDLGDTYFLSVAGTRQGLTAEYANDDAGRPRSLFISEPTDTGAANLEVYPLPDGNSDYDNGEYRIYIPYYRYLTALSADADTNWFTVNAEEYIVEKATSLAFMLDWDYDSAALWGQAAEGWKKDIVKRDKMQRLVGFDTLVPHYRGANSPRVRF